MMLEYGRRKGAVPGARRGAVKRPFLPAVVARRRVMICRRGVRPLLFICVAGAFRAGARLCG